MDFIDNLQALASLNEEEAEESSKGPQPNPLRKMIDEMKQGINLLIQFNERDKADGLRYLVRQLEIVDEALEKRRWQDFRAGWHCPGASPSRDDFERYKAEGGWWEKGEEKPAEAAQETE